MRIDRLDVIELAREANKIVAFQLEQQQNKFMVERARLEQYQKTQRVYELQEIQKQVENFYKGKGPIDFFI